MANLTLLDKGGSGAQNGAVKMLRSWKGGLQFVDAVSLSVT
jgi:hypothetical protein